MLSMIISTPDHSSKKYSPTRGNINSSDIKPKRMAK